MKRILILCTLWTITMCSFAQTATVGLTNSNSMFNLDFGFNWQHALNNRIQVFHEFNRATSFEELPVDQNFKLLAPSISNVGGIQFNLKKGFYGCVDVCYMHHQLKSDYGTKIANNNAESNITFGYERSRYNIGFTLENILNSNWDDASGSYPSANDAQVQINQVLPLTTSLSLVVSF